MAKSIKNRISINAVENVVKEYDNEVHFNWYDIDVVVNRILPLNEVRAFIDDVVNACFDNETGRYLPEVKEYAIRVNTLSKYANFAMPANDEKQYDFVYKTDAYRRVVQEVDPAQYGSIIEAIEAKIDYLCDTNAKRLEMQFEDLLSSVVEIQDKLNNVFGGVSADDIGKLVGAIGDGVINEEAIVKAVLNKQK